MTTIKDYAQKYNELSDSNEYTQVPLIKNEWKILTESIEINSYLPKENEINVTTGITNKMTEKCKKFESIDIRQNIPNKLGYIVNTGGSIWAIDFVPKRASLHMDHAQYLAVGGYNSTTENHKFEEDFNCRNAIQIWQCTSDTNISLKPKLEMCILHDFGIVCDFKWCPHSVYDEKDKLGILAVLFGDGQVRIFVVPHPKLLREQENITLEDTLYIKAEKPRLLLKLPRVYNMCFSWGGYKSMACGTRQGSIVVWNILESLLSQSLIITVNIMNASLLAIRSIAWVSLMDPNIIVSSDSDGNALLHDLNDPFIVSKIFRVRCTYMCIAGTGHGSQFLFSDTDGITRKNVVYQNKKSITLTMHNSLVWCIAASPYHGIVASAASDGSVLVKPFSNDIIKINPKHKLKVLEYTLYRLIYDDSTQEFQYIDGLKPSTSIHDRLYHNILLDPIISIHKVAWNNNNNACGWVASGGKAGLCRIEFTGCH